MRTSTSLTCSGCTKAHRFPTGETWRAPAVTNILLFKTNLERASADAEQLADEIRITVLHEIGHYFGLDEDRLTELGYE